MPRYPLPFRFLPTSIARGLIVCAITLPLAACGGDDDDAPATPPVTAPETPIVTPPVVVPPETTPPVTPPPVTETPAPEPEQPQPEPEPEPEVPVEATPQTISLAFAGRYSAGAFGVSAAEIPAFDPANKRTFIVNAQKGMVDVLNTLDPANPTLIGSIDATSIAPGATVNSVSLRDGIVALAIESAVKTDPGFVAFYRADTLAKLSQVGVGALPDMLTFTPDGKYVLVANEGEPSDDYQIDPEGSVSIIDVSDLNAPTARVAAFTPFNSKAAELRAAGVRIFGPNATVAQDVEPEYIAVSADSRTAWVALQENNALARIDIGSATVTAISALGFKDHGLVANALDASDEPVGINIRTFAGVKGMYMPDAIASYAVGGKTYLVTANEGDARAWGEDNPDYFGGFDASKGFVEEFRVKHLVHRSGFDRRRGDDLPPQLRALAAGALLNPDVFAYCGAKPGDPGKCRDDDVLGRLNVTWTMGYRQDANGNPVMFNAAGAQDAGGDRLMYDALYAFGGRSFSIRDEDGALVWDSGAQFERYLAGDTCKVGPNRDIDCKLYFNSGHDEGDAQDSRSDAKGPEPEGVALGKIGNKTFAFIGLERMGGIMVYDVTDPTAPTFVDYYNTRSDWTTADPSTVLSTVGDLGPEGLTFVSAAQSPTGNALLIVGNEVSGTTAVYTIAQTLAP